MTPRELFSRLFGRWAAAESRRLQQKKGAEINSAPAFLSASPCPSSLSGYYPREAARCHIKTPADQVCLATLLVTEPLSRCA
jgi:hypothetical protein